MSLKHSFLLRTIRDTLRKKSGNKVVIFLKKVAITLISRKSCNDLIIKSRFHEIV